MRALLIFSLLTLTITSLAQKPVIDSSVYKTWPSLSQPIISDNGKYITYMLQNIPLGSFTLVLQNQNGSWKKKIVGGLKNAQMTSDGNFLLFTKGLDSLGKFTLGTNKIEYISNVSRFQLHGSGTDEVMAYYKKQRPKNLILRNLKSGVEHTYTDVINEHYSQDHKVLILSQMNSSNENLQSLAWIDLISGKASLIWKGTKVENVVLDTRDKQLAFLVKDSLYYYRRDLRLTKCISSSLSSRVEKGFEFSNLERFNKDSKHLIISLRRLNKADRDEHTKDAVQIWSYTDINLPSEGSSRTYASYAASVNLVSNQIIRFQESQDDQITFPSDESAVDTLCLINKDKKGAEKWSLASKYESSLVSVNTGKVTTLSFLDNNRTVIYSRSGKYLIFFDFKKQNYFSYEISTKIIRNLTQGLTVSWAERQRDDLFKNSTEVYPRGFSELRWSRNDEFMWVYDSYDIWKIDPSNKHKPVNLTNGLGRKNNVTFNFTLDEKKTEILAPKGKLYLTALNNTDKNNGFYLLELNDTKKDPKSLIMGPYIFNTRSGYVPDGSNFSPIKAKSAEVYITRREDASTSPNYYLTRDFKTFTQVSDLHPEGQYNWLTTELHSWRSLDGRNLKGILYIPQNFDPSKKYPVIFHYYERKSDGLHAYIPPEPLCGNCNINIPTYVSQEYLVFVPDIYYKVADPMQGTYDAIISAANYISTLPFVNPKRFGLQGCSFGGIQTSYLVANSSLFSAACSVVGFSNWISSYGALDAEGNSGNNMFETGQPRMGASLWQIPNQYIKNSAVLNAHKVTTPFLMMNNKSDGIIPYNDAISFFTGLRRLGKKAWLLSYPQGGHGVYGKDANDFSLRMMQFFDHYLKDKPAPVWMTRGIPEEMRGVNNGYEYDKEITTPGPSLLNLKEQSKVDSLMNRKPITVTLK